MNVFPKKKEYCLIFEIICSFIATYVLKRLKSAVFT